MFQPSAKTRKVMLGGNYFWWSQQSNTIAFIDMTEKQGRSDRMSTQSWLLLSESLEPNMQGQET